MASQHGVYHTKYNTVNDTLKSFVAYENAKMCQHRVRNTITELKTRAPKGCKRRTGAKGEAKKCQNTRTGKRARKIKVFGIIALVVALGASPPPPISRPTPFNTLPTRRPPPPKVSHFNSSHRLQ